MAEQFANLCGAGDLGEVKELLQGGADLNSFLGNGTKKRTALMVALNNEKTEVASFLLRQEGIDVNIGDSNGWSALHCAARNDENIECLAMILARPDLDLAKVYTPNQTDSWTSLHTAASAGAARCLQLLLNDERIGPNKEYFCHDDCRCYEGVTPIMLAVMYNHAECVEVLLAEPRVDVMTRDWSRKGDKEVAR